MVDAELASCRILKLLKQYGGINGNRHKQWLFDQIMQEIEAWQEAKTEIIDKSVCLGTIGCSAIEELSPRDRERIVSALYEKANRLFSRLSGYGQLGHRQEAEELKALAKRIKGGIPDDE